MNVSSVLYNFLQSLPPVSVDLSSTLIAVVGFTLAFLGKRAMVGIDTNITSVHTKIDTISSDLKSDIKDLRIDLARTKDKADDKITAVRLDLEGKLEIHDGRIRALETK